MMTKTALVTLSAVALGALNVHAQLIREGEGFKWGGFEFSPEASASAAYDNRVVIVSPTEAEGDFYGELAAGLSMRNLPARYAFNAYGNYGYRYYRDFSPLNDDFYSAGGTLGTSEGRLNWTLLTDYRKRLNYDTVYDPNGGREPDSILSNEPNTRFVATGDISYAAPVSEKTSVVPDYSFSYYNQDFDSADSAEWQVHRVAVPVEYALTDKTAVFFGGAGSLQVNKEEDGRIATVYAGAQSRATEKTTYSVNVGYSWVNYDVSGEDQGFVTDARAVWRPTEKVTAYVFGGNQFYPGYGGGAARMVYRLGYGAGWRPYEQWSLGAQVLHDYQQAIGGTDSDQYGNTVRNFISGQVGYDLVRWARLALSGRYVIDEQQINQAVVSLRAECRF